MHHHLSLRNKLIIMISVMASFFLVALDQTIIATALGKIVEDFNSFSSLAWVVTAYLMTTTITTPIAGKLSDLFGRRVMLLAGVVIFTLGSLLSGMSGTIDQLILFRALQGIGGGILTANAFTVIGDLFAARERGKWQGLLVSVFGVASIIGPLLGGFLTEGHALLGMVTDWRWTFFINIPIGIIAFIVIAIFCPPLKHANRPRIDYLGAGLLALILATVVLAVDNTEMIFADFLESTGMTLTGLRLVMAAIIAAAIAAFIAVERRTKEPILYLEYFKNRNFLLLTSIAMLVGAGMFGAILYLTQFNQQVFGATPTQSGLMLLPMMVGMMSMSVTMGIVVSKTGKYKRIMVTGLTLATIAIASLTTLNPSSSFLQEAIIMVLLGAGLGATMPLMNIAIQNEFEQKDLGVATSANQLFRGLGSTVGIAVLGSMLTLGITNTLGDMNKDPYVQTIRQSPEGSKNIANPNDTNTILNLNTADAKDKVLSAYSDAAAKLPLPDAAKTAAKQDLQEKQRAYGDRVVNAFSDSLRTVFVVTAILMLLAGVLSVFLKERTLRSAKPTETPGEL